MHVFREVQRKSFITFQANYAILIVKIIGICIQSAHLKTYLKENAISCRTVSLMNNKILNICERGRELCRSGWEFLLQECTVHIFDLLENLQCTVESTLSTGKGDFTQSSLSRISSTQGMLKPHLARPSSYGFLFRETVTVLKFQRFVVGFVKLVYDADP
jgi:hypothetical protein